MQSADTKTRPMPELVIEAGRGERQYWKDLWRYRELFYFLAWRDLLVRYKQTVVGLAWAFLRPLLTMVILTFIFRKVAKVPADTEPYALMVLVGILAWNFFATSLQEAGQSLVTNANLISKVYFPRMVAPAATVITTFVDFLIASALLVALMLWYRFAPSVHIVWLPCFVLLAFGCAIGAGLWASALMVRYRDVRFLIPFAVQFGLYLSPIGIKTQMVPEQWRLLYSVNPIVGIVDGFRWSILGGNNPIFAASLYLSLSITLALLISGVWYFRRTERSFADVI
jgi:lipopolysaccharide transport system permease protein